MSSCADDESRPGLPRRLLMFRERACRSESAGLLLYRWRDGALEVLLVHPGGPFWAKKDEGAWTIPKGEIEPGEEPLAAARREFREETGHDVAGDFPRRSAHAARPGGKIVRGLGDRGGARSPPRSRATSSRWNGRRAPAAAARSPKSTAARWFALDDGAARINKGQVALLDALARAAASDAPNCRRLTPLRWV